IATSLLLIVINGYKIIYYIIYESQFQISNIGLRAYKRYEKHLTKKEFHHLMGICNISQLNSGVIVQKGDEVKKIMLILKGKAVVLNNQGIISELEPGDFIGEFGALSGDEASATIESKANLTVACWDPSIIDKEIVLGKIVSLNILKKLIANNKSTSDSNV
ncbi:MAG: cyclic nucleotide-binding domain-containing protein, partial [Chlamydiota bacterium]